MAGPLHEPHHHPGPLPEPADVQGDLRGQVGRAVQVAEGAEIGCLAGRAGGHALVELGHPPSSTRATHPPFDRVGLTAQQVLGPGQPAVRHRIVPQAFGVLAGEQDGHMRGRFVQVSTTVGGEGALPGLDRTGDVGQPPRARASPSRAAAVSWWASSASMAARAASQSAARSCCPSAR